MADPNYERRRINVEDKTKDPRSEALRVLGLAEEYVKTGEDSRAHMLIDIAREYSRLA